MQQQSWFAATGIRSLPPDVAWDLTDAARRDLVAAMDFPPDRIGATPELEAERQLRAWSRFCRKQGASMLRLTKAEQRRAVFISFDDTPRERLAAAWAGASDKDRRDLLQRVIGVAA